MGDVITIDGPAGSGKSTVARILAGKIGYTYLDTGAMYRAIALLVKERNISLEDKRGLKDICRSMNIRFLYDSDPPCVFLGDRDISDAIRTSEMDMLSSRVSAIKEVREAMKLLQRDMAENIDIVAEGRDMGTVVFPDARIKFFLTASFEIRAERRYSERRMKGDSISFEIIKKELMKRDLQDSLRDLAPLRPAMDAIIVDTTDMDLKEVVNKMLFYIENC